MDVVVVGGSGFLGRPLCAALVRGQHRVVVLSRNPARAQMALGGAVEALAWDPARPDASQPWVQQLRQAAAVVNLAGENVGGHGPLPKRWNAAFKARVHGSRLVTTRAIVAALGAAPAEQRPGVLVNASAIGYYGDRGDEPLDESSAPGGGFLADVCRVWEGATEPAESAGVRVVRTRFGLVLTERGGLLPRLLLPFRLGVGGRLGDGRAWMSCVALDDVVGAVAFALATDALRGPVNVVGPEPVRNAEFTDALARVLHRPALLAVPKTALRLLLGTRQADEMALASQRVLPRALLAAGYAFRRPTLEDAIRAALD
jgi:uncharacterized protein (TIGR01777 family)